MQIYSHPYDGDQIKERKLTLNHYIRYRNVIQICKTRCVGFAKACSGFPKPSTYVLFEKFLTNMKIWQLFPHKPHKKVLYYHQETKSRQLIKITSKFPRILWQFFSLRDWHLFCNLPYDPYYRHHCLFVGLYIYAKCKKMNFLPTIAKSFLWESESE